MKQLFSDETIAKIRKEIPDIKLLKLFSFGNGLIRPSCASFRDSASKGVFKDNGLKELNEFLAPELGYVSMQETIMQWLVKFCGYSGSESDTVRRAIAKKKGTEKLLPEIERRFVDYTSENYDIPKEKCEQIIKPFLQIVLDASAYGFSWNHSDAYSCIGYACGYLRYYYPLEFLTTCLNIWDDDEEKTAKAVEYANKKGFKVKEPQFRYSKSDYFMDRDTKTIYKGMRSIKYLNEKCSDDLYNLRKKEYKTFTELLYDIRDYVAIDSRQIEILIRLDYFKEFGNSKELLKIYDMFVVFKSGNAKSFSKSKFENDPIMIGIMERHSFSTEKQYTKIDCVGILNEYEEYIKSLLIQDFNYKEKMAVQNEYLGYINMYTGIEEDRPKLIVLGASPMISKFGEGAGKPWAVMIHTQSMGSNIKSSFTIKYALFKKNPVNKLDIIYVDKYSRNSKGYLYLDEYHQIY
jgi:DNA polymerase-3 subunit alpha